MAEGSCRILTLPPEIRNRIYSFLQTDRQVVFIQEDHEGNVTERSYGKDTTLRNLQHVFRSCTLLSSEVGPIIYGTFNFTFFIFRTLKTWLSTIGSMIQYVRNISVLQWNAADAPIVARRLEAAKNLTTFELGHKVRRKPATAVASAFGSLVKALQRSSADEDAREKAFRVVRTVPNPTTLYYGREPEIAKERQATEDYNSVSQTELRRLLA